jgi:hypothetical protein
MDRRRRFWLGLIVLLLAPLVVLAAFVLYVYFVNSRPQAGDLQTRVSPQVVMPWAEAVYYFDFAGFKPAPTPAPSPTATPTPTPVPTPSQIDMVFIVDESSSMTASIATMASAAQTVVQDLSKERRGRIRYAAIRFDDTATTQTDWTDNPDQLAQGLGAIAQAPKGGGTDGEVAFSKLQELLAAGARPQAEKVVIFYTDGQIYSLLNYDTIRDTAQRLRNDQHVDFYSVGPPYQGSDPIMTEITGDPDKVFDPLNPNELARMFQEIKVAVAPTSGSGSSGSAGTRTPRDSSGQLSHRLDGRHFATPLEGTSWMPGSGAINLTIRPIPEGPATFAHPLVPRSAGLWTVGLESPRLIFFDKAGTRHQVTGRRPLLLKITYFTLFLMLLPAILWSLAHLVPRRRKVPVQSKVLDLEPVPPPTFPEPLPLLPRLSLNRLPPIPTLFVGLGGAGRRALHAVRADLKQAHLNQPGQPYQFLWVDTDTQEAERKLQFEVWEGYDIAESIPPPAVRQTADYLPETRDELQRLQWFNPNPYREAPRAQLNLTDGAKGERPLARLALFKWLSHASGILSPLIEHVKALITAPAADGQRQIVIFASADGGVGSGWFLDFGRLFQRIARQENGNSGEALPDVIGVLCDSALSRHPGNKTALLKELETALTTRKFPVRVTYVSDEGLLDQVEAQSPYHWVFSVTANDEPSVAAQAGELASVLVERHPRAGLLDLAQKVPQGKAIATQAFGVHVLPTLIFDQVRCELFLGLLGNDVLLDVIPDAQGGLKPLVVAADRPVQLLEDWSRNETAGSLMQLVLQAAIDSTAVQGFATLVETAPPDAREWFGRTFTSGVNQRLQGQAAGDTGWERGWKPGEAIATLRLLSAGLSRNVKSELVNRNAPAQTTEIVDHLITLADAAANDLERWVQDFCRVLERIAAKQSQLDQARQNLLRMESRTYVDLQVTPKQVKDWARSGLESWLGTPDTISAIRKCLFFAIEANGSNVKTSVESFITKEPKHFASAEGVATEIDQLARTLALNVPAVRIGGVLAEMSAERRRDVARELVRIESQPPQVLLVLPQTAGLLPQEQQAIEEFGPLIPKPPTHGPRTQQQGDDHSAVRRIELAEASDEHGSTTIESLPFVEMPESIAEAVRRRAEKKYKIALPIFPSRLRIALAYPTAFLSFARAYKAGQIVLRQDDRGIEQWSIAETGQFLTFGSESSLDHAAANYARDIKDHPVSFVVTGEGGNFSKLEQWRLARTAPDNDTLTQVAVDAYEV